MRDSQNSREVALTVMVSLKMKNICYWNARSMRIYDKLYPRQRVTCLTMTYPMKRNKIFSSTSFNAIRIVAKICLEILRQRQDVLYKK